MTVRLGVNSPRLIHARRFGAELDKAMRARKVGAKPLARAAGCALSAIANWRGGHNLPTVSSAQRLAEALAWPRLVALANAGRTDACLRCGRTFVNEGGGPKRFCSPECRTVDIQLRKPRSGSELAATLDSELAKPRLSKAPIERALATYRQTEARWVQRTDAQGRLIDGLRIAIAAMCAACEPDGICKMPDCALRDVSPLPLGDGRPVAIVTKPDGAWGPAHRATQIAAVRAGNALRWARPGERDLQSRRSAARAAARTPEERQEFRARISAARGRSA